MRPCQQICCGLAASSLLTPCDMAVVSPVPRVLHFFFPNLTLPTCSDTWFIFRGNTYSCPQMAGFCHKWTSTILGARLRAACPKTCNACATYAPAATCSDAPSSGKILNGKNLTCSQAAYLCRDKTRGPLIRGNCPRTCNSCPAETMPPSTFPTSTPAASSQPNTTAPAVGDQPD